MRYVVMECHTSYAIVLAEDGRFLNVANMHYEVGQIVTDVFAMQLPAPIHMKRNKRRWLLALTVAAACLILFAAGVMQYLRLPYASIYMSINPEVRIDVNKRNEVLDIDGLNYEGVQLLEGYVYDDKHLDLVTEELVTLAVDMGYLSDGGEIRLSLDAEDDEWEAYTGNMLKNDISEYLDEKLSVTIRLDDDDDDDDYDDDDRYDDYDD